MNKREIFLPYMILEPEFHLKRSLENLREIKETFIKIIDENNGENELLNIISGVVANWANTFVPFYHSLFSVDYRAEENSVLYNISTNLPDVKNEIYLTAKITMAEREELKNLRLFSVSHSDSINAFSKHLYDDNFIVYALPLEWMIKFIIARKSIEMHKEMSSDKIEYHYYLPEDKASIEVCLDINKLDLVRDRWYYLLTKEEDFVILDGE